MRLNVKIDTRALKARTLREAKRLAFSTAQALNETAKEVQREERANLDRKFTIRRKAFMKRLVKIFKFANARQGRPFVEIGIDPTRKGVLLPIFEEGGTKPGLRGSDVAIVPITGGPARPTFRRRVPPRFRISQLAFGGKSSADTRPKPGKDARKGKLGTFMTHTGIFQRVRKRIRTLYIFSLRVRLKKNLGFIPIARRVFNREFEKQFRKAFNRKKGQ